MRAREFDQPPGCVLYAEDTGRWGFQQRSDSVTDPGVWSTWGGGREPGETLAQCVRRELAEESGYQGEMVLEPMGSNSDYATFVARVPREFEPRANAEIKDYCWVNPGQWPQPLHPDLAHVLNSLNENFADGKNPGRKGLAKRMGVPTKASISKLRQIAKSSSGEKRRMAHWMANMKAGKKK